MYIIRFYLHTEYFFLKKHDCVYTATDKTKSRNNQFQSNCLYANWNFLKLLATNIQPNKQERQPLLRCFGILVDFLILENIVIGCKV